MQPIRSKPWLPYVVPMGIYMAFLLVQSDANLLWMYPVKTLAVAAALIYFRKEYVELRSVMWCRTDHAASGDAVHREDSPRAAYNDEESTTAVKMAAVQSWGLAILVGLVAIVIWIGIDPFYPKLGKAVPFDPTTIAPVMQRN